MLHQLFKLLLSGSQLIAIESRLNLARMMNGGSGVDRLMMSKPVARIRSYRCRWIVDCVGLGGLHDFLAQYFWLFCFRL